MRPERRRLTPRFDRYEERLALSTAAASAVPTIAPILSAFSDAYLSAVGSPKYNPIADANHNGIVAMGDAVPLLRTLARATPRAILRLTLTLAPGQQANTPHPANSGGVTRKNGVVTVIGHTVPNSLVFTDDKNNDFRFRGGSVIPVDSAGFFSFTVTLSKTQTTDSSTFLIAQHNLLVIDPFGQQAQAGVPDHAHPGLSLAPAVANG